MALRKYIPALIVLIILAGLHFLGTYHHLYFVFPFYDVPAHFLGGLWVGLTALWVSEVVFGEIPKSFVRTLVWVLSAALCFAVVWEMFEFYSGVASPYMKTVAGLSYWADVTKDLAVGLIGSMFAFLGYKSK
jgi:hypothetical protein